MDAEERIRRLEQIEKELAELLPTRTKRPIVFEDYTGELGDAKLEKFEGLLEEKHRLMAMVD